MLAIIVLAAALTCLPLVAAAQMPDSRIPEIRPFVGGLMPTGDNRDVFKDAVLAGTAVGYELGENLHLVGTFAWSPGRHKLETTRNRINVYAYTLGVEMQTPRGVQGETWLRPFVGAGVGGTSDHLRDVQVDGKDYLAGYGSLGAEVQMEKLGLRLEGRDYVHQFKGIEGTEKATTRNFVMVMAGLTYHIW